MSRTYRRLHAPHERAHALRELVTVDSAHPYRFWWYHRPIDPRSPQGREALARFHSDAHWTGGPPQDFRQLFNRSDRRTAKMGLARWWRRNDHDELLTDRPRYSAAWAWW